jgi:hypothetical protein
MPWADKDTITDDAMGETTFDLGALQMVKDHEDLLPRGPTV